MILLESMLLMSTGISFVLLVMLFLFSNKKSNESKQRTYLTKDLIDIKEQISEE